MTKPFSALLRSSADGDACAVQGPLDKVYSSALALGTANQLTNILRDVGEDVNERNRIYLPLEELERFGIAESEVRPSSHRRERAGEAVGCCTVC